MNKCLAAVLEELADEDIVRWLDTTTIINSLSKERIHNGGPNQHQFLLTIIFQIMSFQEIIENFFSISMFINLSLTNI